jgi:hypothetical protein
VKLVNLTPETFDIADANGNITITLRPSGNVAKVYIHHEVVQTISGIPVISEAYFEIVDLPKPKDGVMYIVSEEVARAAKRPDVVFPKIGPAIINKDGLLMTVTGLQTFG